jgi:hypothetical protein
MKDREEEVLRDTPQLPQARGKQLHMIKLVD